MTIFCIFFQSFICEFLSSSILQHVVSFLNRTIFCLSDNFLCDFIVFSLKIVYNNRNKNIGKVEFMMVVTATEFKTNFGKYLDLISKEDIFITRNGKTIAKVVNPQISAVDSLRGILKEIPSDIDMDSLREERLSKHENNV